MLAERSAIGVGFALPREAGRRPRSKPSVRSFAVVEARFAALRAACRSETGAPAVACREPVREDALTLRRAQHADLEASGP